MKPDITGDFDHYIITFKYKHTPQVTPQVTLTKLEKKVLNEIKNNVKISRINFLKTWYLLSHGKVHEGQGTQQSQKNHHKPTRIIWR